MKYPTVRVVFDRKKQATKASTGLVQIEILYEGKRKFVSTGVKVYAGEWKDRTMVTGRIDSVDLNERINLILGGIREFINELIRKKEEFKFELLERVLHSGKAQSFIDFVEKRIEERTMKDSTRGQHRVLLNKLRDFGGIQFFSDLTVKNIKLFDNYIRTFTSNQSSVYSMHKRLKVYVKESLQYELISKNPYDGMVIARGESISRKYLTAAELENVRCAVIQNKSLSDVRDCFVFCCFTGMAYADLSSFNWEKDVEEKDGRFVIKDTRQKTGVFYNITILSPAMDILKLHDFKLPVITNQQYNMRLKLVAEYAQISRSLTSHMARHTFATWALSQGIRIEVVSKMLAHTDIKTTQIYAKILQKEVAEGFDELESKLSEK